MAIGRRALCRAMACAISGFCLSLPSTVLATADIQRDRTLPEMTVPLPTPDPAGGPEAAPEAAFRSIYQLRDIWLSPDAQRVVAAFRVRLVRPESLQLGNITLAWHVDRDTVAVHRLTVHRDGNELDLLDQVPISKVARNDGLEAALLDGVQVATLQVPGLAVGDELEMVTSVTTRDPTLGRHVSGAHLQPLLGIPGLIRLAVSWPADMPVSLQAGPELGGRSARRGDRMVWETTLQDPPAANAPEGAPPRYQLKGLLEYSDFANWESVSAHFWPLYRDASELPAESPVKVEAARIASSHAGDEARAMAALALVQERVRYVYVGLAAANLTPAHADESWQRRFADCKGKTALLMALLRELGIPAEAVLVNAQGGDGIDRRLPGPGWFNHVVVRASVGGRSLWMDGTQQGDDDPALLQVPNTRWALALAETGRPLEAVPPQPLPVPLMITVTDIDASSGLEEPARMAVTHVLRGDPGRQLRQALSMLPAAQAEVQLKSLWRQKFDAFVPDAASWRTVGAGNAVVVEVRGAIRLDWDSDDDGAEFALFGGGFFPPSRRERPPEQDQGAPWLIEFPRFDCDATTIRLPPARAGMRWRFASAPMNRVLEGQQFYRATGMEGNVARLVRSKRALVPEISAADARATNDAIDAFDNKKARVVMDRTPAGSSRAGTKLPYGDDVDWTAVRTPCLAP